MGARTLLLALLLSCLAGCFGEAPFTSVITHPSTSDVVRDFDLCEAVRDTPAVPSYKKKELMAFATPYAVWSGRARESARQGKVRHPCNLAELLVL